MVRNNFRNSPKKIKRLNFFSRWEMAELPKLLMPDEQVLGVISGFYVAGTAILCVTSKRLLLVDKKWMRLSFEDIRFNSIKEVKYSQQAFASSVRFFFAGRELQFRSWYKNELRTLAQFVQQKMFEAQDGPSKSVSEEWVPLELEHPGDSMRQTSSIPRTQQRLPGQDSQHLDRYLNERIDRWRRAIRFVDTLTMSSKTGRQVLELETQER